MSGADITGQGYVASPGNFLFYPAIQASPNGSVAMVFTLSGPNFFGSAAYARMDQDGKSFGKIKVAALGSGPYDPNATRWGDYSFAVADPNGESIWLATEYIPPLQGRPLTASETGAPVFSKSALVRTTSSQHHIKR